jgi:hypothetical protein
VDNQHPGVRLGGRGALRSGRSPHPGEGGVHPGAVPQSPGARSGGERRRDVRDGLPTRLDLAASRGGEGCGPHQPPDPESRVFSKTFSRSFGSAIWSDRAESDTTVPRSTRR